MKRLLTLLLLCSLTGAYSQTKKALFLGNSYIASNNLPNLVYQLALSNGDTLIYDANTPGGYTYEYHSTNATTISKINADAWDFVILQEQSQKPSFPPAQVATDVYPFAADLDSMINANDPCTETVFFMTWGRKYGDQSNCASYPPLCTYQGMQDRLRTSYLQMTNDHEGICAAVGSAFWYCRSLDSTFNLYTGDYSHPNINGSYLAACVFYATMWRESPVGLSFTSTLSQADAQFLQNVAHTTVFDSLDLWRIGADDVASGFTYSTNGSTVSFTDTSSNATQWQWNFGDGNNSTLSSPNHTYSSPGTYNVELIVSNGCETDTTTQQVIISAVGIEEPNNPAPILLYPNPVETRVQIEFPSTMIGQRFSILDVLGKEVYTTRVSNLSMMVNMEQYDSGVYFLKTKSSSMKIIKK